MQHDSPIELLSMVTHAPSGQRCYVAARSWPANGHGSLYDLRIVGAAKESRNINAVTAGEISDIAPPDLAACGITEIVREKPLKGGIGAGSVTTVGLGAGGTGAAGTVIVTTALGV